MIKESTMTSVVGSRGPPQIHMILGDSCSCTERYLPSSKTTFEHHLLESYLGGKELEFTGRIVFFCGRFTDADQFYGGLRTIYGLLDRDFFTDTEYSCFFCVFCFELYADLSIALTIVHCDGTSILSLYTSKTILTE